MLILEIANLRKSYVSPDGARGDVIQVPQFFLHEDEQLAMEGASGSSKTTRLQLIAGLLNTGWPRLQPLPPESRRCLHAKRSY
jgi:ABC-type sugar transport system ATPase subunit